MACLVPNRAERSVGDHGSHTVAAIGPRKRRRLSAIICIVPSRRNCFVAEQPDTLRHIGSVYFVTFSRPVSIPLRKQARGGRTNHAGGSKRRGRQARIAVRPASPRIIPLFSSRHLEF